MLKRIYFVKKFLEAFKSDEVKMFIIDEAGFG